ncbi:potassium channel protein [Gloeocapsopsis sp. IPPAS B-1203]|uniref:potassium channel family protein n=1 Tax=Gloeocapsopsis sp. IPPAS B-1203 TaxID=2049454 RepID=UPI000C1A87C0|nr:potassium channel protein [Gloeocapsopsis sp. IPPAS B-1203]PIG93614.1 potassium channel protein [Gloeocapsopsis sp. IPPAS B-1203]
MKSSFRNIVLGAIAFVSTIIIAVMGYVLAGWSLLDAVYMSAITIFGVGYGEVRPITSPALRVFTILVIVAGYTSVVFIVGGVVQMVTEGEINKALHSRRREREMDKLQQHVIICGFGRIGEILARRLARVNQPFIVIDGSGDRIAKAEAKGYLVKQGNAADETILHAAGIQRAKALATVLPDDAVNVFITLTARELNPDLQIIARGELPSTEKKLRLAGADQVVLPAAIGAERMAHMITHPAAMDFLQQDDGRNTLNELLAEIDVRVDELAIPADSPLANQTVSDIEIRGKGAFIVVALRKTDGTMVIHPKHEMLLEVGDTVIVMGHRGDIPQFAKNYVLKRDMRYRGSQR